jgi:hypothetical protein
MPDFLGRVTAADLASTNAAVAIAQADATTAIADALAAQATADTANTLAAAAAVDLTDTTAPSRATAWGTAGTIYEFRAQGTTMLQVGATSLTITNYENATPLSVIDSAGKWYRSTSAATNDNAAGFRCLDTLVEVDQNPWLFALVRLGTVITHETMFVCMAAGNLTGGATWPNNSLGFGCNTEGGDTAIQVTSCDNSGVQSSTSTGVTLTASHIYALGMKANGQSVYWSIEDITAGTTTSGNITTKANMPSGSTGLGVISAVLTRENVAKRIDNAVVRVGVL